MFSGEGTTVQVYDGSIGTNEELPTLNKNKAVTSITKIKVDPISKAWRLI